MSVAVVAALREEMAPLARRLAGREPAPIGEGLQGALDGVDVWLMVTGDGERRASSAIADLLATLSVEALIGIGVGGGLTADLALGHLVVVERVLDEASGRTYAPPASRWVEKALGVEGIKRGSAVSARAIAADAASKRRLADLAASTLTASTAVVDLESAAWCEAARDVGIPFVVARVVTDTHDEALPLDFETLRDESGAVDRKRVLRAAALRPRTWPHLLRLRRRLAGAGEALADWSVEVLAA